MLYANDIVIQSSGDEIIELLHFFLAIANQNYDLKNTIHVRR